MFWRGFVNVLAGFCECFGGRLYGVTCECFVSYIYHVTYELNHVAVTESCHI